MSRDPEAVARITENTYKNVMDQFNPGLRNLVNLGKNYEKAVSAMVLAGRAYYDGVAKMGEISRASPVSKELGQVLLDISIVHKKLNDSLEENFRKFHREIIAELERKTEQDVKYMNATLKRYQTEHKHKVDSLEKSQAELKKLRRKSQGARNATKYDMKETEYLETITSRQNDIQKFIAEGCREALLEEKRRFCFLVDKHCNFSNYLNYFHIQSSDLLTSKIPKWQETCSDVSQVPDTVINNMNLKTPGSTPISGTPEPSPLMDKKALMAGEFDTISRNTLKMPPAPPSRAQTSPLVDMFNNPAVPTKVTYDRLKPSQGEGTEDGILPRSMSVATGLNLMKKPKVRTIFPHTGNGKTLLSFQQGDIITLLLPEEKDGWMYGEHDTTKLKGWFPSSYTRPLEENGKEYTQVPSVTPSPAPVRSLSTANLLEKSDMQLPEPDYLESSSYRESPERERFTFSPFIAKEPAPAASNGSPQKTTPNGVMKHPFLSGENPFATVKLRPTVTNDRSAPVIR